MSPARSTPPDTGPGGAVMCPPPDVPDVPDEPDEPGPSGDRPQGAGVPGQSRPEPR